MPGYLADTFDTYIARPWREGGAIQRTLGPVAAAVNLTVRGVDEAIRALTHQEYQAPQGIMGNTRRDLSRVFSHLGEGEFVKAASNTWSILSGDLVADAIDLLGFRKRTQAVLAGAH